ncbi:hypothetical protein E2C01_014062 [Portunus trituberculatus]|uniref:Uncharacterized protein n=1 Tax=Portunus trituberculatus TaxID=210409 RepID=A0A5B7DJ50_PORTR|nr:hypothetical protein [Portunus trituberculatus]
MAETEHSRRGFHYNAWKRHLLKEGRRMKTLGDREVVVKCHVGTQVLMDEVELEIYEDKSSRS